MVRIKSLIEKLHIVSVLEYVLVTLILLYSSMWSVFTKAESNTFIRLAYPVLFVLLLLRVRVLTAPRIRRLLLLVAALAAFLLFTRYNVVRYGLYFVGPLLLLTVYMGAKDERGEGTDLFYKLSDVVFALTAFSLVCYIFGTCLGILPGETTVSYHFANADRVCPTYFHLYYAAQPVVFFGQRLVRNCGIFAEAPGFAVFLIFGLSTEVFLRPKVRIPRCIVYCLAAATTFSTKALMLVILILGLKYVVHPSRSPLWFRIKSIALPFVAMAAIAAAAVLLVDKVGTTSFRIRVDDVLASLRVFGDKPLFGAGYYNDDAIIAQFQFSRPNNGLSMGLAVLLAQGGLFLTAVYILPMIACLRRFAKRDRWPVAAFFITYLGLLFVSNIPFSFFTLFLLAFAMEAGQNPATSISSLQGEER
ncbi:MAG: hypothetical protein IIW40_03520 [Clostridia bacterium]|nr:hypothetical protein [Clostridia bacterium]